MSQLFYILHTFCTGVMSLAKNELRLPKKWFSINKGRIMLSREWTTIGVKKTDWNYSKYTVLMLLSTIPCKAMLF